MAECSKHPLRKRKDCSECFPSISEKDIKPREIPKDFGVIKITKESKDSKLAKEIESRLDVEIKHFVSRPKEEITLKEIKPEADKIKDFIDKIINERLALAKKALYELGKTEYEHLIVPSVKFNIELMLKLEKDGWGYCHTLTCTKEHQYGFEGSAAIFKRIKHAGSKPAPVFMKGGK